MQPYFLMNGIHLAPWLMSFYNAWQWPINSELICGYTKTHQAETITLVINWCWSVCGERAAKCHQNFIYLYIFFIGSSSVVQSISVQSLLFSEVIKQRIDLLTGDSYLLPPPPVLCFVPLSGPRGGKVWSAWKLKPTQYDAHPNWHWDLSSLWKYMKVLIKTSRFVLKKGFDKDWGLYHCAQRC